MPASQRDARQGQDGARLDEFLHEIDDNLSKDRNTGAADLHDGHHGYENLLAADYPKTCSEVMP